MEKKEKDANLIETLLKENSNLELQNQIGNRKLQDLVNKLKSEEQKRNWYEVKNQELQQSTTFYKTQIMMLSKKLIYKKKILSQFELATECYKRLIMICDETLKPQCEFDPRDIGKNTENEGHDIHYDIKHCRSNIQENLELINDLLRTAAST